MAGRWYYRQGTAEYGPVSLSQLVLLVRGGEVSTSDWVREGETNPWRPMTKATEVMAALNQGSPPAAAPPARRPVAQATGSGPVPAARPATSAPLPAAARPAPARAPMHNSGVQSAPTPRGVAAAPAPAPVRAVAAAPAPVRAVSAVAPVATGDSSSVLERRKKSSGGTVVALAIAGIGGLAIIAVVVMMASMGSGDDETKIAKKDKDNGAASAEPGEAVKAASTSKLSPAQSTATSSVKSWREVTTKGGLKGIVMFQVKRVYWVGVAPPAATALPEEVKKVEEAVKEAAPEAAAGLSELEKALAESRGQTVADPPATEATPDKAPEKVAEAPTAAPKLCVEIEITNTGAKPLAFQSWNSKAGAWLVDRELKFVSFPAGSGAPVQIAPQESITETLEFTTKTADFTELRLVLPYSAVGEKNAPWGYMLDSTALADYSAKGSAPVAVKPAQAKEDDPAPAVAAETKEPAIIETPEEDPMPDVAANKTPKVPEGEPTEDIRDIIKRSVGGEEKKK